MDHKEIVLEQLKKELHAVMATVDDQGNPEAALIGFAQTDDLTLIIGTSNKSRKYSNLMHNNNVALVIGGWKEHITVQYEGIAVEVSGEEKDLLSQIYLTKIPEVKKYAQRPEQKFFKILPRWIRCTGYSKDAEIFEITF